VFTKCGLRWNEGEGDPYKHLKPSSIRKECEDSLRRLDVDAIDLYQIHWPVDDDPAQNEEGWRTLADLRREGKVRWIGVSNWNVPLLEMARQIAPVTSLQPPYSLVHPEVEEEILPYCERNGIGVIVYSPMQSGLLTGAMTRERAAGLPENDWRRGHPDFTDPNLSTSLRIVDELRAIGDQHGRSPGEVAIAWTLRLSSVTGAIVGARNGRQVQGVMGAGTFRLTEEEIARLDAVRH
jgi:aryl-alcohol dehydrogenase-like predicted oxidoreductase